MAKIIKVRDGFEVKHTTREVWGVDDPPETGEHESDCECRHCVPEPVDAEERYIHED